MSIFKSYDIRGVYQREWNGETVRAIGRHLPSLLSARHIAIGRDARVSSEEILRQLTQGITEAGSDVFDIGPCDTPAVYFATAYYGFGGSVMITASHNPPEYNGLKISGARAVPIGLDSGLARLEELVTKGPLPRAGGASRAPNSVPDKGVIRPLDIRADYLAHMARFKSDLSGLRAVIDCSNGMAGIFLRDLLEGTRGSFTLLFEEPDGRFPNHAPNPLQEENLAALKRRVKEEKADVGICFDGDADRVMFVDENARFVSPDLVIGLIGSYYFRAHPQRLSEGSRVVTYDVRSSRAVAEHLRGLGAEPVMCKVGHSHAKKLLRESRGVFGGELAGHYYFRENYCCDSGMIAALVVLETLAKEGKPFSGLINGIRKYFFSGELNFSVPNGKEIVERIRADYREGSLSDLDGIRVDYPAWWFNLRTSNTEPLLRMVVEADTREELGAREKELVEKIGRYSAATPGG